MWYVMFLQLQRKHLRVITTMVLKKLRISDHSIEYYLIRVQKTANLAEPYSMVVTPLT